MEYHCSFFCEKKTGIWKELHHMIHMKKSLKRKRFFCQWHLKKANRFGFLKRKKSNRAKIESSYWEKKNQRRSTCAYHVPQRPRREKIRNTCGGRIKLNFKRLNEGTENADTKTKQNVGCEIQKSLRLSNNPAHELHDIYIVKLQTQLPSDNKLIEMDQICDRFRFRFYFWTRNSQNVEVLTLKKKKLTLKIY